MNLPDSSLSIPTATVSRAPPSVTRPAVDTMAQELATFLTMAQIVRDPQRLAAHAGDWSEAPHHSPSLVVYPKTPQEVADVLATCTRLGQPIAVQGGLTGLAGGATPIEGEIALSLSKLDAIEELDTLGGTVCVQAGVVLEELQRRVELEDWSFPLDLGARGSCQVGGNAATNAGGNRVIRFGTMRDMVLGLEVALPNGRLLTMLNRVTKNTTGVDLKHLFIGAEGTLGVITRLILKLSPKPGAANTALCALPSFEAATRLLRNLRRALPSMSAFEVMWSDFMDAAAKSASLRLPFNDIHPVYVLVETLGQDDELERAALERELGFSLEAGDVTDVIVAQSVEDGKRLWTYRESVGELLGELKPFAAFDVGIPMARMESFVQTVGEELRSSFPLQQHLFFGHIGDGNLHVLSGPHDTAESLHKVEHVVYTATGQAGGAVSAEHGIGVVKKEFLDLSRGPQEIALMQQLKAIIDPACILNPGRILD